jgi:hypothetical protein
MKRSFKTGSSDLKNSAWILVYKLVLNPSAVGLWSDDPTLYRSYPPTSFDIHDLGNRLTLLA